MSYVVNIDWVFIVIVLIVVSALVTAVLFKISKKNTLKKDSSIKKTDHWHARSINSVLEKLSLTKDLESESVLTLDGLSAESVIDRRKQYGENKLEEKATRGPLARFMFQFHNVLIYVLIVAGVVTAVIGHWIDAVVIFSVVFLNAMIGFVQEGKAENALRAIRKMLSLSAMVFREGQQTTIRAVELVPGDIVLLQSGDKVPADLRLFRVKGLQIEEAVLTGESMAVEKYIEPVAEQSVIGDRSCIAYSGTLVTHGQGAGVVVAIGAQTEIGRISELVAETESVTTPLLEQVAEFGRWLTATILVIALATFLFGVLLRDYSMSEMFLAAVSLVVAAIPEGLPAIMTITLATGVQAMARRNAIIRRLPAVETLGAVSVICSDKTGTFTRNEMTVRTVVTTDNFFVFEGTGYNPHGAITLEGKNLQLEKVSLLDDVVRAAMLCNDTSLEYKEGEWHVHGDPMEGALLVSGLKAGLDRVIENKRYPRTDLIPFESEHRFMATLHHSHHGDAFIFLKGAPEQVLEKCAQQRVLSSDKDILNEPLDKKYWLNRIEKMASLGQRVLAIAIKPITNKQSELKFSDVENGMILLGMFGLIDPPREEAIAAVGVCYKAGIRVKMITGDHAATARAIASQLRLNNIDDVLTGEDLDQMTEIELGKRVLDVDVYARVNPEHKLLLVRLMQEKGLIVAMTGDGVNDAPALKRADVGTAMGQNGTEAAKEAAEMVLADDNFVSISHAVEEGRTVYDNLKKAILFILPTNGGEALIILGAIIMGFRELPLTPVQILWVNMVTAVTLALSLAFEPAEKNVMQRPPRGAHEPMLTKRLVWRVVFVSIILMYGTFALFLWEIERGASIEFARTVAVNTLVMFEIFYLFNSRYISESIFNVDGFTGNRYVLIAIAVLILFQLSFTYIAPMQLMFGTASIDLIVWLRIVLVSSSVLFLVEIEKYVLREMERRKSSSK